MNKEATLMKKPTAKIREEIARLQEQLKQAETRDAERIGRIALRAGLGEIEIEEGKLLSAFEEVAARFRAQARPPQGRKPATTPPNGAGEAAGRSAEA
ncbi:TraC family protein [Rhizobium leguminosarum]|nr:TraC family protein [Rhizobium leguminosarum]